MTQSEIAAATDNPAVDWGYIDRGPRRPVATLWRRLVLWSRIVGRTNQTDCRTGPILAWTIGAIVHPWRETIKAWGIVDDRR